MTKIVLHISTYMYFIFVISATNKRISGGLEPFL